LFHQFGHLDGQIGKAAEQLGEVVPQQHQGLDAVQGLDGGRTGLVEHQRHLAESLAQSQLRQDQFALVDVFHDVHVALADDVEGVSGFALPDDDLVGLEALDSEPLGDGLNDRARQGIEERVAGDEVGNLFERGLRAAGHAWTPIRSCISLTFTP